MRRGARYLIEGVDKIDEIDMSKVGSRVCKYCNEKEFDYYYDYPTGHYIPTYAPIVCNFNSQGHEFE